MNKLSSIYQALESGNNKGALKLCNALLLKKKDENTNAVKILKAITLAKLNEIEEAIKCADEVAFTGITNEQLLSNLNYFYKSVQRIDKMTQVYEASYKANPKSVQLAKGSFLAYTKVRDLKQQQQMVLTLQKQFPSEEHSHWYLMTILSMVQDSPTPLLLGLAQKMAEKLVSEDKIKTSEQLFMYETILSIQGKKQEHLDLIKGKMGELYNVPTERLKILASLYQDLSKHQEAADSYKEILVKYEPDEWSCYMGYFDNLWALNNGQVPTNFDEIQSFIKEIQKSSTIKHKLRGPFIAEIELLFRKLTTINDTTQSSELAKEFIKLLLEYFTLFGNKPIFYQDAKKYLAWLIKSNGNNIEELNQFLESIDKLINKDKDDQNFISKLSNYYKVQRALNLQVNFTLEQTQSIIESILEQYNYNVTKFPLSIESERYPGDDLILVCYFLLMDQIEKNPNDRVKLMIDAISILEFGHSKSTKNFQFNLYLMKLYFEIGNHTAAISHFKILNIKNIQWDTLGYLVMDQSVSSPVIFSSTVNYFDKIFRFYGENDSTSDYIAACYSNGCYSKILEIIKFQDKVSNSYQKQVYSTERQLFNFMMVRLKNSTNANTCQQQLLTNCKSQLSSITKDQVNEDLFKKLSFNQDRQVYDEFNSTQFKQPEKSNNGIINSLFFDPIYSKESDCILVLKFRREILNILTQINLTTNATILEESLSNLNELINQLTELPQFKSLSLNLNFSLNIFKYFNLVLSLLKNNDEEKFNLNKNIFTNILTNLHDIVNEIQIEIRENEILSKSINQLVSNLFEPLSWLSWVLIHLNTLIPSKRAKKKEEYHIELRSQLESIQEKIDQLLTDISLTFNEKSLASVSIGNLKDTQKQYYGVDNQNNNYKNKSSVLKQLFENNNQSITEIQQYINCLKNLLNFSVNNNIN